MRKFSLLALMLGLSLASYSQIIGKNRYKSDSWKDNWEISFGGRVNSFSGRNVSLNGCLGKNRVSGGVFASVGKWVSPMLVLRTEFDGIWSKYGTFGFRDKFFQIQEMAGIGLLDAIGGYRENRSYNVIPFVGGGYRRDMTFNENKLCWSAGVDQTIRLNDLVKLRVGIGVGDGGGRNAARLTASAGFSVALGKQGWTEYRRKFRPYHGKKVVRYDREKFDTHALDYSYVRGVGNKVNREPLPEGMSLIRRGTIVLGLDSPDSIYQANSMRKQVSVNDFWMDEKEVTNAKWRQFVEDVRKRIVEERAAVTGDRDAAEKSIYRVNELTGEKTLDISQMNFVYHVYDYQESMKDKYRDKDAMITKDTAWIDRYGKVHSLVIRRKHTSEWDFVNSYAVNVYPDTTCWVNDYPNSSNGIYSRYYFGDGAYDNYPVVGVSWKQANAYCYWRTELLARKINASVFSVEPFRLPTEAEFEYAARGREGNEFPWETRNPDKTAKYANFKNSEGDYLTDGNLITCETGRYRPNTWGLYDMAGNVAEWTSEIYYEMAPAVTSDINPEMRYHAEEKDTSPLQRKAVRGGSWKDQRDRIRSAWRTWEYQDKARSYIGFRCVRNLSTAVK